MKKIINIMLILSIIFVLLVTLTGCKKESNNNSKYKIVTSFYPIYIMVSNITEGANNIELNNMTDVNSGCVHKYTLQITDLKKLEKADMFIQNGLEIENFMDKILDSYKDLKVINSTENLDNVIKHENEINGHTWLSIDNNIKQIQNITNKLKEENSENAEIYEKNANNYIAKLTSIKQKYDKELTSLKGRKVVSLNESFDYLLRDLELNAITLHTDHEESTVSAEKIKHIIEEMKKEDIKIIIIDKNDNEKNAQNLANETGAKIYKLDSGLTGNMDKDSYINTLNDNLEVLKQMI